MKPCSRRSSNSHHCWPSIRPVRPPGPGHRRSIFGVGDRGIRPSLCRRSRSASRSARRNPPARTRTARAGRGGRRAWRAGGADVLVARPRADAEVALMAPGTMVAALPSMALARRRRPDDLLVGRCCTNAVLGRARQAIRHAGPRSDRRLAEPARWSPALALHRRRRLRMSIGCRRRGRSGARQARRSLVSASSPACPTAANMQALATCCTAKAAWVCRARRTPAAAASSLQEVLRVARSTRWGRRRRGRLDVRLFSPCSMDENAGLYDMLLQQARARRAGQQMAAGLVFLEPVRGRHPSGDRAPDELAAAARTRGFAERGRPPAAAC